ncbi:sensor domain-containing diguanylate cyclase [Amphritea japonica]|uniref:Signal transduction protein n=1 Tax=Amphritea japonica ATCC BAA-1530 TaxID=1278309 RepID=A0A7R6PK86_9GAMM|nr:cache domain-containing protein [Amphritea japonica]BBB25895.1 signal transduction protein [Amphritea japonica ATCC BAA-1530]
MLQKVDSTRLPTQLLWGISFIVILLLFTQSVYFYINTKANHQQQLDSLRETLIERQRSRLATELHDAEQVVDRMFAEAAVLLKQQSRLHTRHALALMNSLYQRYHLQLSEKEMKQMLIEALRGLRFFDGRGYFFIDQMDGVAVLLPIAPHVEGESLLDNQDDTGHFIMRGLIDAVSNEQRAGYSYYRWYAPENDRQMKQKIAYVEVFEPYNWIVGTGDYIHQVEKDLIPKVFDYIRNIRFGETGYVAVQAREGTLLVSNVTPEKEGLNFLTDSNRVHRSAADKVTKTALNGGGYVLYEWFRSGSDKTSQKLSLVGPVNDRNWILIAGIFQDELNQLIAKQRDRLNTELRQSSVNMVIVLTLIGLFAIVITQSYSRWLKRRFHRYQDNIDKQQTMLHQTAESLKLSGLIVESAYEGIAVCDPQNRILKVNSAFTRITGYEEAEIVGNTPALLGSGRHDKGFYLQMWKRLNAQGFWRGEIWNKRKNGEIYPQILSITAYKDLTGKVQNYIAIFNDITQRVEVEQQLRSMAETDPLTGLGNRRTLMACLDRDLAAADRYGAPDTALLFVDLDHFKAVNDTYGHDIGDAVLIEVANCLKRCLRDSDLACRIGGDEFVAVVQLQAKEDLEQLEALSSRLLNELVKPVLLSGVEIELSCSVGVSIRDGVGDDGISLMKRADQALYEAKRRGRGRVVFYSEEVSVSPSPAEAENL